MASRQEDWLTQAKRGLDHAVASLELLEHYDWAAFAAQQAAEMAVKALYQSLGGEVRGHSIEELIKLLAPDIIADEAIIGGARTLDRHYIPSRYPNTTPAGAPAQLYTEAQAVEAIESAREILRFCESHILR